MPPEPPLKRTVVFVDGQNLFHAVRDTFGYPYPNYDIDALARAVTGAQRWQLIQTRFYTGLPDPGQDAQWHHFWSRKLGVMGRQGVHVFARPLSYRNKAVRLPDGSTHSFLAAEEKGVDVRRGAHPGFPCSSSTTNSAAASSSGTPPGSAAR